MPVTNDRSDRESCISRPSVESSGKSKKRLPTSCPCLGFEGDTFNLMMVQAQVR